MPRSSPPSLSRLALALSLVVALAGCSLGRIDYRQINSGYDGSQYHWIPYNKGMWADVSGNPFAIPQDEFNKIVATSIQAEGYIPVTAGPRVRMVFNNAAAGGDYICQSSGDKGSTIGRESGGHITLSAAFCSGGSAVTFATGSIDNVTGPDDPHFRSYLRNMVVYLFPLPESTNDPNFCMFC